MGTYALSGAAVFKAGTDISPDLVEGDYDYAILQAENFINDATRYDFSGAWATLSPSVKYLLEQVTSDLAAIYLINFDMNSYGRTTATTMIEVLRDRALQGISLLRDKKTQDFMTNA